MSDIVKRLDIKAGVMEMGERIAWGSDTALMREAARAIEAKDRRIAELEVDKTALMERDEKYCNTIAAMRAENEAVEAENARLREENAELCGYDSWEEKERERQRAILGGGG